MTPRVGVERLQIAVKESNGKTFEEFSGNFHSICFLYIIIFQETLHIHILTDTLLIESTNGIVLDHRQVHFMPKQVANIIDIISNHSGTLQTQPPRDYTDVFGQSHWA